MQLSLFYVMLFQPLYERDEELKQRLESEEQKKIHFLHRESCEAVIVDLEGQY